MKCKFEEVKRIGPHLVVKAAVRERADRDPEAKTVVYLDVTEVQALNCEFLFEFGTEITLDDMGDRITPSARFPSTEAGWKDAIQFAVMKNR